MEYRQLGRSGLRISRLTLGTMTFGGRGPLLYPFWHQRNTANDRLSEADLSLLASYL